MSSLFKKLLIALIITFVLGITYYFTIGNSSNTSSTNEYAVSGSEVSLRSQKILSDIMTIDHYKLDVSIFDDPRFRSLTDIGVTIQDVPTGRNNPFAPVE